MEKILKQNGGYYYKIGNHIVIQQNKDNTLWLITIEILDIFNINLCSTRCSESEVARYAHLILNNKLNVVNELIKDVIPLT